MATIEVDLKEEIEEVETKTEEVLEPEKEEKTEPPKSPEKEPEPVNKEPEEDALQTKVDETTQSLQDAEKLVAAKGFDYATLTKEYEENGKLSDATYKALEEKGLPKEMVETFIRGLEATSQLFNKTVYEYAGGVKEFEKLQKYVEAQGEESVKGFNQMIESCNLQGIKLLIKGIKAEMTLKNGTQNSSVLGSGNVGSVSGFTNEAEWIKAVDDPRYGEDEAYTKRVAERLMKSSFVEYK